MGLHKFESRRVQKQKTFADISAIGRSSSRYFHGFRRRPQGGESGLPASFFELHRQIATRGESRMDAFWRYTHKGGRCPWISVVFPFGFPSQIRSKTTMLVLWHNPESDPPLLWLPQDSSTASFQQQ